jgi:hypothetical protein
MNADLYSPRGQALQGPTVGMRTLHENIKKLKLNVERHVPVHGGITTHEEFLGIF